MDFTLLKQQLMLVFFIFCSFISQKFKKAAKPWKGHKQMRSRQSQLALSVTIETQNVHVTGWKPLLMLSSAECQSVPTRGCNVNKQFSSAELKESFKNIPGKHLFHIILLMQQHPWHPCKKKKTLSYESCEGGRRKELNPSSSIISITPDDSAV